MWFNFSKAVSVKATNLFPARKGIFAFHNFVVPISSMTSASDLIDTFTEVAKSYIANFFCHLVAPTKLENNLLNCVYPILWEMKEEESIARSIVSKLHFDGRASLNMGLKNCSESLHLNL